LGARLEVRGLVKRFGGLAALDGLDLALAAGELRALVGPNGCGKSTLFNLISGGLAPDAGAILLDGVEVGGWTPREAARAGVGRKFQSPALFDDLSAAENVLVPRWLRGLSAGRGEARERLAAFGLSARGDAPARDLSHGERQRLEIAMLLAAEAELLLLDEPTAGLTASETAEIAELVRALSARQGRTVLVVEHDMAFVERLACPVTVMSKGRALRSGAYVELRADPEVRALYFGRR
jgi:ABC-type branched-subunit amino acid transport system ATPase component